MTEECSKIKRREKEKGRRRERERGNPLTSGCERSDEGWRRDTVNSSNTQSSVGSIARGIHLGRQSGKIILVKDF